MKILRLDLRAYGPFTDAALDFPADGPGFHLIHGPNEAGKSTTLRALRCLLFGFPARVEDGFRHEGKRQRVGATIRGGDGTELTFLRRRGKSKTLRGPDDESVVDDEALARLLNGIGVDRFRALHSTDLDELTVGGRQVIEGRGDLGSILIGGSGLSRMPQVLRDLRSEAEALYKPRASNPTINAALASLKAVRREMADALVSGEQWLKARDGRVEALRRLDAAKAEHRRLDAEHRRLDRLAQARPILDHRALVLDRLAAIGPVADLPDDFAERWAAARTARDLAALDAESARAGIIEAEAALGAISVPDGLLAEAEAIDALREGLGERRARRDGRPGMVDRLNAAERDVDERIRRIAPDRSPSEVESLRPSKAQRDAIKKLDRDRKSFELEDEGARQTVEGLRARLAARPPSDASADASRLIEELTATLARVEKAGDLDAGVRDALGRLSKLEARAATDLGRLPLWSGTLDALAIAAVPSGETVNRFEAELTRACRALEVVEEERGAVTAEIEAIDAQAATARGPGDLPTEADLAHARAERDAAWSRVVGVWVGGDPAGASGLAVAYERLVAAADARADLLRREADRVARLAELSARRTPLAARAEALPAAIGSAAAEVARVEAAWAAAWRPAKVAPLSPAEMRGWLARQDALVHQAAAIADARSEADLAGARRDDAIAALGAVMKALDEPPPAASRSVAAWIERARAVADRGGLARDLDRATADAAAAAERLGAWRASWARAVAPLGLGPGATPDEAETMVEQIETLAVRIEAARVLRDDLAALDLAADRFASDVEALARRVAVEPGDRTPEAVLDDLRARLEVGRRAERDRAALARSLAARRDDLRAAEAIVAQQTVVIDELRRRAGCDSADAIPAAVDASNRARPLRLELADDERQLAKLAAGRSLDELAREAEAIDADDAPARLRDLAAALESAAAEVEAQTLDVGRLGGLLDAIDGGAKAADANEKARAWLSVIESDVEQFVRVRLAEAVLKRAIDVYRERNQGTVLGRASALFAELTVGAFSGVRLDDEDEEAMKSDGAPVLKGVRHRPVRELIRVEEMSLGTANALYLAVRLATLEAHLDRREPLPFVVDDILVQLDDARASAALAALADLARSTQVLFFTHHEHLVSLAREALPANAWSLHRVPSWSRD